MAGRIVNNYHVQRQVRSPKSSNFQGSSTSLGCFLSVCHSNVNIIAIYINCDKCVAV